MLHKIKDIKICVSFCAQYRYMERSPEKKEIVSKKVEEIVSKKSGRNSVQKSEKNSVNGLEEMNSE